MQGVINGITFGVEDYAVKNVTNTKDSASYKHLKAGMVAGFAQALASTPMELVKLHTQHQKIGEYGQYQGNWVTLKRIWHREGIQGCNRGLTITMVRETTGCGVYFATYEGLKDTLAKKQNISGDDVSFAARFIFGGIAGIATWACNYPIDLAKTRFQLDGINGIERQYRGSWDVLVKAWKDGGIRLLYRGLNATLVRGFAFNMFTLPVVDLVKQYLSH